MTSDELNAHIEDGTIDEEVRVAEARQMKTLSKIADVICGRPKLRLVLIAGGSSAGKTTTAKRIATQLRVNGRAALHLSTDDYFVGDARNPRDENGNLDYEHVECVDIAQLSAMASMFRDASRFSSIRAVYSMCSPSGARHAMLPRNISSCTRL